MAMTLHPSPDQLRAFLQGRLADAEAAGIEEHVAGCDSCCQQLEKVPDDTLLQIARAAATEGVKAAEPRKKPEKSAAPEIPPELVNHPRYRVLGVIGVGGMGAVYKAEHRLMKRLVALKVISRSLAANPAAVERFTREFVAAGTLGHPSIVAAHDADQAGDLHFLVMEFVEGVSLDRLVSQQGRLTPQQAANLIRQAALGLQHAHEKGMVHRDIKPQNLMITKKGQVKILDFGLARLAGQRLERAGQGSADDARPGETTAGMLLGTPDYVAPEQVRDARQADIRADIYSLGCTFYYLLTGQPPFAKGTVMDRLASHMNAAPAPLSAHRDDVPPELARIVDKMLAKDPAQRYQTPGEVAKALAPIAKSSAMGNAGGAVGNALRGVPGGAENDDIINLAPAIRPAPANIPPTETSILNPLATNPLDPLATDADLGVALGNLPPLIQAPATPAFPFNNPKAVIATLIACGAALALMLLVLPIASCAFLNDSSNVARSDDPREEPKSSPISSGTIQPDAPPTKPSHLGTARTPANSRPRKVLLVVPSTGLWSHDYVNLKSAFDGLGIEMDVASTTRGPVTTTEGRPMDNLRADALVDKHLHADGYGAIIFAGYRTDEYHPDGVAGPAARELVNEFKAQRKVVAAICVGQRALDAHGFLSGKNIAKCSYLAEDGTSGNWMPESVVVHGNLITAARDSDAWDLAQEIAARLDSDES